MKTYAKKGSIPKFNEIWKPVGEKQQLFMVHFFAIERVRPYIPDTFEIIPVAPGITVGYIFNGYFGPESTLEYHELIISPALVAAKGRKGFYTTHMYVDNEKSLAGGKKMGLPKEMVTVDWQGLKKDRVHVHKNGHPLLSIYYKKYPGAVPLPGKANVLSQSGDQIFYCKNTLKAKWSFCKTGYDFHGDTCLKKDMKKMGFKKNHFFPLPATK